jgi:hypothetical protein
MTPAVGGVFAMNHAFEIDAAMAAFSARHAKLKTDSVGIANVNRRTAFFALDNAALILAEILEFLLGKHNADSEVI